jgi:hypothetical protein
MPAKPRRPPQRVVPPEFEQHVAEAATWDAIVAWVTASDDIDDGLRPRIVDAVAVVRAVLGEDWPRQTYGTTHPLAEALGNHTAYAAWTLVDAARDLQEVKALPGHPTLVHRLRQEREGVGALAELQLAGRAARNGYGVRLGPSSDGGRFADLLVTEPSSGVELHVEVTVAKRYPDAMFQTEQLDRRLIPILSLLERNLAYGGGFMRAPQPDEIEWLEWRIATFLHQARVARSPRVLVIPGLLELYCVGKEAPEYEILRSDGLVDKMMMVPFTTPPPLLKLLRIIQDKVEQLPTNGLGLIVVRPPDFLGPVPPLDIVAAHVRLLIALHPHVVGVAMRLRLWAGDQQERDFHRLDHDTAMVQVRLIRGLVERVIYVRNPMRRSSDADALAEALLLMAEGARA